jgi:hypothetical protein
MVEFGMLHFASVFQRFSLDLIILPLVCSAPLATKFGVFEVVLQNCLHCHFKLWERFMVVHTDEISEVTLH